MRATVISKNREKLREIAARIDAAEEACKTKKKERIAKVASVGGLLFLSAFANAMSAFGTKQTSASALQMSAFGGKADMPFCTANVRL